MIISPDSTIPEMLDYRIAQHPDQLALIKGDERITYHEFGERVKKTANVLFKLGVRPGDKVAMVLSTGFTFPVVMFATFQIGGVAVAVNPNMKPKEIKHILIDSEAVLAVVSDDVFGNDPLNIVRKLKPELPELRNIVVDCSDTDDEQSLKYLCLNIDIKENLVQIKSSNLAALIYSSGTTGLPKGAMHTHRNLLYPLTVELVKTPNFIQMIRMIRRYGIRYLKRLIGVIGKPITIMYTMPPFTGAGMVATVMFLLGGRITVLQDRFSTSEAISLIEKEKVNMFGAVPALAALLLRDPKINNHDISSLIYLGCGAAFVSPALVEEIRTVLGCPTLISYGTTEMLGTPTTTDPFSDTDIQLRETVGKIQDGFELRIVDENRKPVQTGEIGEISLRSPSMMLGYFKAEEHSSTKIDDEGWYYTGDLGSLDENNYLRITGRIKDMIIRAGQNIYPAELEALLVKHPDVGQVSVVGVPDDIAGEKVVAFIIPMAGTNTTKIAILNFCRNNMAPYKVPHDVRFVDKFPTTSTGKVLKRVLREEVLKESLSIKIKKKY